MCSGLWERESSRVDEDASMLGGMDAELDGFSTGNLEINERSAFMWFSTRSLRVILGLERYDC